MHDIFRLKNTHVIVPSVLLYVHVFFHIHRYLGLKEPRSDLTTDI